MTSPNMNTALSNAGSSYNVLTNSSNNLTSMNNANLQASATGYTSSDEAAALQEDLSQMVTQAGSPVNSQGQAQNNQQQATAITEMENMAESSSTSTSPMNVFTSTQTKSSGPSPTSHL